MSQPRTTTRRLWAPGVLALVSSAALTACGGPAVRHGPPPPETVLEESFPDRPLVEGRVVAAVPTPELLGLRGGTTLLAVPRSKVPAVWFRWVLPGGRGIEVQPTGKNGTRRFPEGTMTLLAELLTQGTKSHPGEQFAAAIKALGGDLEVTAVADGILIQGHVLSHQLGPLLGLLREAVTEPELSAKALAGLQQQYRASLQNEQSDPEAIVSRLGRKLLYGDHPYGSTGPTLESLGQISRQQLVDAHKSALSLGGGTLVMVGDLVPAEVGAMTEQVFASLLDVPPVAAPVPAPALPKEAACHVVDVADASQTAILQLAPGYARKVAGFAAMEVGNQVLGGSGSSRLFADLREKRGLTYGIYSGLEARKLGGHCKLATSVRNEVVDEALQAIEEQIALIRRAPPSAAELMAAQQYLAGQFALSLALGTELADWLALGPLYDLPKDSLQRWMDAVQAVQPAEAQDGAAQAIPAAGRLVVAAGPLAALRPALDGICPELVQRDVAGKPVRTLLGPDADMGEPGRAAALTIWRSATPSALTATARFVAETARSPLFRAAALANLVPTDAWKQTVEMGRKAPDWQAVSGPFATAVTLQLADPDLNKARWAKTVLLTVADATSKATPADMEPAGADVVRKAVVAWAFTGLDEASQPADVRAQLTARLDEGDLARLGDAAIPTLELWIAADLDRHLAAELLQKVGTPEAYSSMVAGYRKHLARGGTLNARDLTLLAASQSVDVTLLLLDGYANQDRAADKANLRDQRAVMATIRQQVGRLEQGKSGESGALALQFDRLETHLEGMLQARFADDRYWAADLLIRYREGDGMRRVLERMSSDDRYRDPQWHDADPKTMLLALVHDAVAKLGKQALPRALSALSAKSAMGKVLAVATIRQLGDDGTLAALRTNNDDTDVSGLVNLPEPVSVRDLCRSAVEVRKLWKEVDEAAAKGSISALTLERYKRLSLQVFHLTDKALRIEVDRLVRADAESTPDPEPEPEPEPGPEPEPEPGTDTDG